MLVIIEIINIYKILRNIMVVIITSSKLNEFSCVGCTSMIYFFSALVKCTVKFIEKSENLYMFVGNKDLKNNCYNLIEIKDHSLYYVKKPLIH